MTEHQDRLDITPRVVDLGDRVIQLQHVVSVGRQALYPFRPFGALLVLAGFGLIGNELVMRGLLAFKLQSGGSLPLWLGFGAAGIGLFLLLYARRVLMICTSDGGRVELPTSTDEAAAAVILRIRHAMEELGSPTSSRAGASATPALQGTGGSHPAVPWSGAPSGLPQQLPSGQARPQLTAEPGASQTVPVGRRGEPYANGHAGRGAFGSGGALAEGIPTGDPAAGAYRRAGGAPVSQQVPATSSGGDRRALGAEAMPQTAGREPLALPSMMPAGLARDDGSQELIALVEHVRRADVQHKDALLDLLKVVEDSYRGRASREDAVAHWRSFADYVVQYLGDVDGLIAHTERFGRYMVAR
jgi:hypothetical protein